ncbi:MAG: VOC family protein [Alphaproteobacteria bacterium]|nr:VOC family protein [Alphaproteobacteria bacterium]
MQPAPFSIQRIDHVVLRISNLEASLHFYRDILGCALEKEQTDIGLFQLRAGDCLIDLVPLSGKLGAMGGKGPGAEGRNVDHICLRIDPFDPKALCAHLRAAGIAAEEDDIVSRYGAEGDGPSLYITDPDGNVVELKGPPGPVA